VAGVRQTQGNTGHPTFIKKNGTSDINTILFGIDIRSTIIRMAFKAKKVFLK
jgi:hypothetical protein